MRCAVREADAAAAAEVQKLLGPRANANAGREIVDALASIAEARDAVLLAECRAELTDNLS